MNYEESVRALLALGRELAAPRQPAQSSAPGAQVEKFGLENISTLSAALGNLHRAVPCAHIAGTNGKGSTAAMLESILRAAGLRTGLYTSPHLERVNERIRIEGEDVSDADFAAAWTRVHAAIESLLASGVLHAHPTYFECVTAMAFLIFAEKKLDFVVYEVGLGGRLDSTNIVVPEVAVITSIDFDHETWLGHSIAEIATEKAGIIKPGITVVSAAERPEARTVIARRCRDVGANLVEIDQAYRTESTHGAEGRYAAIVTGTKGSTSSITLAPSLRGRFQIRNALAAAAAARVLAEKGFPVSDAAIEKGIRSVNWPGRLEKLSDDPAVYLDGTHNPAGARELLKFWDENLAGRRIFLVYGTVRDKAVDEIAGLLFPRAEKVVLTAPRQPRAISADVLAEMAGHLARSYAVEPDPQLALEKALRFASLRDAVFATGSLYLVGEWRAYWRNRITSHDPAAVRVLE
ncbi:MAG TPA: folylpolyglutamate synthase/dihydrofolate synthase family protein [Candidatus Acidoferrum sp.]|nr:folylpolyglutamate synthase/dihydrofolate synthase family protein [Candidatus Acidoferrum sp.]